MIVTLKDGSKKEYSEAMSVIDIAKEQLFQKIATLIFLHLMMKQVKRHTGIQPPMYLQRLLRDFTLMQSLQSDHPLTKAFIMTLTALHLTEQPLITLKQR